MLDTVEYDTVSLVRFLLGGRPNAILRLILQEQGSARPYGLVRCQKGGSSTHITYDDPCRPFSQ